jgi:PTS system mannose-specific IID component
MNGAHPAMPPRRWASIYLRLLAVQGSWNYETLMGNGVGFAAEPALRSLPGGIDGRAYREALGRECRYFNAHPYLASVAVGAVVRAELDGVDATTIERFRTASCSPLGSLGDQLVWAAWLPFCSLLALAAFGLGASPLAVVPIFLIVYNAGHLALRAWGLAVGFRRGLAVASALSNPVLREGPLHIARAAVVIGGFAVPLTLHRAVGGELSLALETAAAAFAGALVIGRVARRQQGWRMALALVALLVLYGVTR